VIAVSPDTPVAEIANLLESRRIKRVPVLQDGALVGIVSRANLVQALASSAGLIRPTTPPIDDAIKGRLAAELERQPWWRPAASNVMVAEGVVHYWGLVDDESERVAARVAAENVPGVRGVEDHRVVLGEIPSAL
jgi:CBS domain-containing protein